MDMTRRNFFIGSMAVAALGARRMFADPAGAVKGAPRLKVGVLSDIHVRDEKTQQDFIKALEWYRDQGADAVLVAGDMADWGLVKQLKLVADAWFKVFPDNKAPDGRPVCQLLQYGNHDMADWRAKDFKDDAERAANMLRYDPKKFWEAHFHEAYEPVFRKEMKGYSFVGAHWPAVNGPQIEAWFQAHGKDLDPAKPFLYFQHPHPKDTCYGPWAWGHDNGQATAALNPFPNAIALSGHSHYTLTDERTVWQGAFTSIGTSSLSYTSLDYNYRENAPGNNFGRGDGRKRQMGKVPTGNGKQGMLFTYCDDHIRIARHEFVWDQPLGDDWILPVGKAAEKPFVYAKRKPARVAPEFPEGAAVKVALVEPKPAKDAKPTDPKPAPTQVEVTFPAAEPRAKCRVFEYEVQAVVGSDDVEMVLTTRRALAPDFHLPASQCGKPGSCVFALSDLPPNAPVRFDVTPLECFGKRGRTIRAAELFTAPKKG